jgi:glycosyltransferase involved in cell wall biosynthesis
MKILFLPDWSRGNPYQRLLADALAGKGVPVSMDKAGGRWLPLRTAVRKHGNPAIVHLHWLHPFLLSGGLAKTWLRSCQCLADLALLKLSGTRVVWTVHNLVNHERRHAKVELLFNRLIGRLCDCLIVHYPEAIDIVRRAYRLPTYAKVEVVPHGHYIDCYPNKVDRSEARRLLGLRQTDIVFLFFGTVRSYKGVARLVAAFQTLKSARYRLVIAGRVSSHHIENDLSAQCAKDRRILVRFESIPDGEVQCYMAAADAVVLPSSDILTSGSAVLAMSFGKAIVAADTPHLRYLLGTEGGILYDPAQETGLHRALEEAASTDLQPMGVRNYGRIRGFPWCNAAETTFAIYQDVLRVSSTTVDKRLPGLSVDGR